MKNSLKYTLALILFQCIIWDNYAQCTATPNLIFNGSAQFNSSCIICDRHNENPSECSTNCGAFNCNNGYTQCNNNDNNNLDDDGDGIIDEPFETLYDPNLGTNQFKLTPDCFMQGGSIWNDIELDLNNDFIIEAELDFGNNQAAGADGIAFVLQTDPNTTSSVTQGGSVGHGGLEPALIFEFDSHPNTNEPNNDHFQLKESVDASNRVDLDFSTSLPKGANNSVSIGEVESQIFWHLLRIEWVADPDNDPTTTEGRLNVFFDANRDGDIADPGDHLVEDYDYDVINTIFPNENGIVFWGFTSATGCWANEHRIQNINPIIQVDFNYSSSSYCKNESNPSPDITGQGGGTFSSTAGLLFADVSSNIGSSTGEIDLVNSSAGTYTIRYEIDATCFVEKIVTIDDNSSYFSYDSPIYCQSQNDPSPTFSSCLNGDFISSSGLVINSSSGQIDLDASLPGTYTISWMVSPELVEEHDLNIADGPLCQCPSTFTTNQTFSNGYYYAKVNGTYQTSGQSCDNYDAAFRTNVNCTPNDGTNYNVAIPWRWNSVHPINGNQATLNPQAFNSNNEYFFYFFGGASQTISFSEGQPSWYNDNSGLLSFEFYKFPSFTVTIVADPSNVSAGNDVSVCNGASVSLSGSGTCNGVGSIEELFDQSSYGNSITSFSTTPSGNWSNITNGSGDDDDWFGESDYTSSNGSNTGPSEPHTGNDYIYFETSSGFANLQNETAILESISLTNVLSFSFFYHMCGVRIGTLEVQTFDGINWIKRWERTGPQQDDMTDPWKQCTLDFTNINVERIRIIATSMVGTGSGCCSGDIGLDDIVIFTSSNNTCTYNWTTNAANGEIGWSYSSPTDVIVANNANSTHTGTYTFTVTDESGCSNTDDVLVNVSDLDDASFDFDDFCINVNGGPSNVATTGGSFSFNPPVTDGAIINSSSGVISNGVAGTSYIVEYLTNGTCPNSSTQTVSVLPMEDASFTYTNNSYCPNETDPEPTITGTLNGVFSSSIGLIFLDVNSNSGSLTGKVDLSASTPGTYSITYTTQGTCSVNSSQSLTIYNSITWANLQWPQDGSICPSASFNAFGRIFVDNVTQGAGAGQNITAEIGYSTSNTNPNLWTDWVSATYNLDDGNNDEYIGTLSGLSAGTYYYAFRYSYQSCDYVYGGFSLDVNGGGAGGIWDGTTYTSGVLTVNSSDASFSYPQCCYFTNDTDPTPIPTVTGIQGTYSCTNSDLSMSSDGTIDLSASLPGNYTITHSLTNCPVTSNQDVLISNGNNCNTPTFTPLSDPSNQVVASSLGNNEYQITPSTASVRGAVWCDQPLNLDYSFTIQAELNFGSRGASGNDQGADGISFVLHQNYQPQPVGAIGYVGFDPSIAVEFDTYYNSNNNMDLGAPNSSTIDHMAVQLDGIREHSSANNLLAPFSFNDLSSVTAGNIEDGQFHPVTFHWDVVNTTFKIYFDNQLIGEFVRDIRNDFTGLVYWGFASSNGAAWNDHRFTYVNSSFWYGRSPTTLSDNINEWQGDITAPTETIIDPIDNSTLYNTSSWFNPCNWTASFVPDYNTDVVIPQQATYTNHCLVNYDQSVFANHSVLYLDMDGDGDVDMDDQVQGKAFAKSLQMEGNALFFIKTDDGAKIQVKD